MAQNTVSRQRKTIPSISAYCGNKNDHNPISVIYTKPLPIFLWKTKPLQPSSYPSMYIYNANDDKCTNNPFSLMSNPFLSPESFTGLTFKEESQSSVQRRTIEFILGCLLCWINNDEKVVLMVVVVNMWIFTHFDLYYLHLICMVFFLTLSPVVILVLVN